MNGNPDERLGQLLRQDAPPDRDPAFRISLLERSERQRFERRQRMILAGAGALAFLLSLFVILVQATGGRPWMVALAVLFGAAVVAASVVSFRGVLLVVGHLRRN